MSSFGRSLGVNLYFEKLEAKQCYLSGSRVIYHISDYKLSVSSWGTVDIIELEIDMYKINCSNNNFERVTLVDNF